jgi:hypothetical protein
MKQQIEKIILDDLEKQIEMYKKLSELNDEIIKNKDEYIEILEVEIALLTLSK